MKFSYAALSSDSKEVTGVLTSESIDKAKEELHKMGLSILSVTEISEEEFTNLKKKEVADKTSKGIKTYIFLAIDATGKEVEGSIDSKDDLSAYKRLIREYKFEVKELYLQGSTPEEKASAIKNLPALKAELKKERAPAKEEETKEEELETEVKLNEELIAEIDKVIEESKKVIESHKSFFSIEHFKEIESSLSELQRIRTSNNLKHITEVSNRLYKLISEPDAISKEDAKADTDFQGIIGNIKNNTVLKKEPSIIKKSIAIQEIFSIFRRLKKKLLSLGKKTEAIKSAETNVQKQKKGLGLGALFKKSESKKISSKAEATGKISAFMVELNSFVGWLLAFYIIYFMLVDFAIEKDVGLPAGFVLSTLKSTLIINITIFLLFTHLLLKSQRAYFYRNFLGSVFLFFFGYGVFSLLILNV